MVVLIAVGCSWRRAVETPRDAAPIAYEDCTHALAVAGTERSDGLSYVHKDVVFECFPCWVTTAFGGVG
jgi:hypothetical protein